MRREAWSATTMAPAPLTLLFLAAAALSLAASWRLVAALERLGARLGLSEGLLGMLAALAADAPEITAATTALASHDQRVGAGVVIGSNAFNLAALLGLAGVVAGSVALHRRVVELAGLVALAVAGICLAVVAGGIAPAAGLVLVLVVLGPYTWLLALAPARLSRLAATGGWRAWLAAAVGEEEQELAPALDPRLARRRDALLAAVLVAVVVGASIAMEQTGTRLGHRTGMPAIVLGGIVLAAVTSLPNAVAAVYLARRGRGAAVLSTALNSNAINVLAGLLVPTVIVGIARPGGQAVYVAGGYLALTVLALACTWATGRLGRGWGLGLIAAYLAFAGGLVAIAS